MQCYSSQQFNVHKCAVLLYVYEKNKWQFMCNTPVPDSVAVSL